MSQPNDPTISGVPAEGSAGDEPKGSPELANALDRIRELTAPASSLRTTPTTSEPNMEGNGLFGEWEYEDDRAVYLVEDSERHWYVARSFSEAMREHESLMEPEDDEFTITKQPPDRTVTLFVECEADGKDRPKDSRFTQRESGGWNVVATAAQWANHYDAPRQICSSVFP